MLKILEIDGHSLTLEDCVQVAHHPEISVKLADAAIPLIRQGSEAIEKFVAQGRIAYGITTGFGAFKNKLIARQDVKKLQENILLSHAVGVGAPLNEPGTRAMMLIRANTLAHGHSGIRLETLNLLLALLNANILPVIPEKGSLGASGDLAPLAHMSLPIIGQGVVTVGGTPIPAATALRQAGLQPLELAAKEGLALTNGTAFMTALGALSVHAAEIILESANVAAALTLEAQHGTLRAFADQIHRHRPQGWQRETAASMRALLQGSQLTRTDDPMNIQDAYTLRCIPQVHGAIHSAIDYAKNVINIELNALTDNPLLFLDEPEESQIISGGNFHGEPLALALDFLGIAMADLGNISERRIAKLVDSNTDPQTFPPFLTEQGGLNSGFMMLQYTAAALASDNKTLAHPASVDSIPSSGNVEDHVSMGANAARHSREIIENVGIIVTIELMCAAQAVEFRLRKHPNLKLGKGTTLAYERIRSAVPFFAQDAFYPPYMEKLASLVREGSFCGLTD